MCVFVCELSEMKISLNTHIHVTIGIITENWMYRDLRQQQQQQLHAHRINLLNAIYLYLDW